MSIYEDALKLWGKEAQVRMLIEEMGELMVAISKFARGQIEREDVVQEIIDVEIMLKQMLYIYDEYDLTYEKIRIHKITRLRDRIECEQRRNVTEQIRSV